MNCDLSCSKKYLLEMLLSSINANEAANGFFKKDIKEQAVVERKIFSLLKDIYDFEAKYLYGDLQ